MQYIIVHPNTKTRKQALSVESEQLETEQTLNEIVLSTIVSKIRISIQS